MKPVKAYVDSFAGLIPCIVTSVHGGWVTYYPTVTRSGYIKGKIEPMANGRYVIPRKAVHQRGGQYRIRAYDWAQIAKENKE